MDKIRERLASLRAEADTAVARAEDAEAKNKKLEHELMTKDQEIVSLQHKIANLEADLEKAEAMIRKALQEEPENGADLDSLGWVLFKRGKAKEAVEPLEKAVKQLGEISAGDATIFEHLGDVYFQLGETAKAKTAWSTAEKAARKGNPPDKRLPEIQKKLESLKQFEPSPRPRTGDNP